MKLRELILSVDAEEYSSFRESEETDFWNDMTNLQKAKIIR